MPVSSGPGGQFSYFRPPLGAMTYPNRFPYPWAPRYAPLTPMLVADPTPWLEQALYEEFQQFCQLEAAAASQTCQQAQGEATLRTVPSLEPEDRSSKEVNKLTDDLTAALSTGKITPEQAIKLSLGTAAVLEATAKDRESAVKSLRAELRFVKKTSNLSRTDFQKLSEEIDALIRTEIANGAKK
jgi:hypothetical protein